jgi:hypothetical protein
MTLPSYITAYLTEEGITAEAMADPIATLATLRLDALMRHIIAMLIEEHTGHDVRDVVYEAWQTLADVAETALDGVGS